MIRSSHRRLPPMVFPVVMLAWSHACVFDETGIPTDTTCDADGTGPVDATGEPCEFICDERGGTAQCLYASNVPKAVYEACADGGVPLEPTGGMVSIVETSPDAIEILCTTGCGDDDYVLSAQHVDPDQSAWFCLSRVHIPDGVTVTYDGQISESIGWLVNDTVTIAGTVDLSGGPGTFVLSGDGGGGVAGPGGFAGGDQSGTMGNDGAGPCHGTGGQNTGSDTDDEAGGGGGGGGFGGAGGAGGAGAAPTGGISIGGGVGGDMCGAPELVPLQGGSGGGSGGDGACPRCGWSGGGGGGALGIAARTSITISGTIAARGGDGFGLVDTLTGQGGGGGGGAGGALLLESRSLTVTGDLLVDGGDGGPSAAGDGGAGATMSTLDGAPGLDHQANGNGGSGGGGGGGRIRVNTPDGTFTCSDEFASPHASCTAGSLATR